MFVLSGTVWSEQQKLLASDAAPGARFGFAAALSGDTALVGTDSYFRAAYVFGRSGTVWSEQRKLVPSDGVTTTHFGSATALSGTTALIGAPGTNGFSGAAYVFTYTTPFASGSLCPAEGAAGCASGFCKDGYCCESACDAPCQTCAATPGSCTSVTNADDVSECAAGSTCNGGGACVCATDAGCIAGYYCAAGGVCAPGKAQATACDDAAGADCNQSGCRVCAAGAGRCIDGFCCDTTCSGACERCDGTSVGWSGASDGTCATASAGYPGAPACGAYVCTGLTATCTGTSCTSDIYCGAGYFCAADGTCKPRRGQGAVCDAQAGADCLVTGCRVCTTGNCEDGYCCNTTCSGACDVCNATPGTCTNAAKGAPGSPICDPFLCGGSSASCAASCASDAECAADGWCDAATRPASPTRRSRRPAHRARSAPAGSAWTACAATALVRGCARRAPRR